MAKTRSVSAALPPDSYEAAMAELEGLIAKMEEGSLPLEASLVAYQRGSVLVKYCQQVLGTIEQQVKVLEADATLKPMQSSDLVR
ncbi:MAG: exodeoxyribonuclease VII small subunit [Ottowia sp.]|nr:exodeoxyribonuclease VII small subunit [Ottowia sp.]